MHCARSAGVADAHQVEEFLGGVDSVSLERLCLGRRHAIHGVVEHYPRRYIIHAALLLLQEWAPHFVSEAGAQHPVWLCRAAASILPGDGMVKVKCGAICAVLSVV